MQSGDLLGQFKIIQRLGAGGMGQVFLAVDTSTNEDVAIKVLQKDDAFYKTWLPLFLKEQSIYQQIQHPNVVAFVSAGETELFHFTVLEHIMGVSMRAKLNREGPAGLVSTFSWMQEVILGLHAAHQKGYIHSDLKPDNVMLTRDLGIKLIDFGIAREVRSNKPVDSGPYVGTPAYSAPEMLLNRQVTQRADVFAAGLLFYEMIVGTMLVQNPYEKDAILREFRNIDASHHVLPLDDERLQGENPKLLKAIDTLLYGMLRFVPTDRLPSTGAVLSRIETIAEAVGGSVWLLSKDESKLVAQREIADGHLWQALNYLGEGRLGAALEELSNIAIFANSLEKITRQMLRTQLDVVTLQIKGKGGRGDDPYSVTFEGLLNLSLRLLDLCSKIYKNHELYIREFILCKRMQNTLSEDNAERLMQKQMIRRPHSYVFRSAYMRLLYHIGAELARDVWVDFLKDLISRGALVEAAHELKAIEEHLGTHVIDEKTLDIHQEVTARQRLERAEFHELLKNLANTEESNQLVTVCRTFLGKHPQAVLALKSLQQFLTAAGRREEAIETLEVLAVTYMRLRDFDEAECTFADILEQVPNHPTALLGVFACMLENGEAPEEETPQYPNDLGGLEKCVREYLEL